MSDGTVSLLKVESASMITSSRRSLNVERSTVVTTAAESQMKQMAETLVVT